MFDPELHRKQLSNHGNGAQEKVIAKTPSSGRPLIGDHKQVPRDPFTVEYAQMMCLTRKCTKNNFRTRNGAQEKVIAKIPRLDRPLVGDHKQVPLDPFSVVYAQMMCLTRKCTENNFRTTGMGRSKK